MDSNFQFLVARGCVPFGDGVPSDGISKGDGARAEASETIAYLARNREFESISLQRRVVRTMVTAATWSRTAASVSRLSLVSCFQVTSTPWGSDRSATGATPTLPTSASKATAFHVWLRRSVPDAEHLMRCPSRMAENTATRRFCAQCGTPLPSPCPSCGFENEPSARFCGGCGKPPRGDCRSSPSGRARVPRAPIAQNAANSRSCFAIWWAQRRCRRAMTPHLDGGPD